MDTFMDKLAQKLNAQEMIKANSAADAEEMDQLKSQLREYDECLAQMQQVNKELKAINQEMEKLMSETIAPEVTKLSEEGVAALQSRHGGRLRQLQYGADPAVLLHRVAAAMHPAHPDGSVLVPSSAGAADGRGPDRCGHHRGVRGAGKLAEQPDAHLNCIARDRSRNADHRRSGVFFLRNFPRLVWRFFHNHCRF